MGKDKRAEKRSRQKAKAHCKATTKKGKPAKPGHTQLVASGEGGLQPGVNLDSSAELLDLMDEHDRRFRTLREQMAPKARSQGVLTDQDVFDRVS